MGWGGGADMHSKRQKDNHTEKGGRGEGGWEGGGGAGNRTVRTRKTDVWKTQLDRKRQLHVPYV